jgi:signal transduction histidine kinase
LAEALAGLAARASQKRGIKCSLESVGSVRVDDDLMAVHLFRIAQEAVNNAVKHSGASRVVIGLESQDGGVRLEVCDNGRGLSPESHSGGGLGLQIMRHRAGAIGAELTITSREGGGLAVVCILPVKKP